MGQKLQVQFCASIFPILHREKFSNLLVLEKVSLNAHRFQFSGPLQHHSFHLNPQAQLTLDTPLKAGRPGGRD